MSVLRDHHLWLNPWKQDGEQLCHRLACVGGAVCPRLQLQLVCGPARLVYAASKQYLQQLTCQKSASSSSSSPFPEKANKRPRPAFGSALRSSSNSGASTAGGVDSAFARPSSSAPTGASGSAIGTGVGKRPGPDYEKGVQYWEGIESSVDGVLGGFGEGVSGSYLRI